MQKMSITMITILLFVQILSNGFAQIPNTGDEETLEDDFEMPSHTSSRNNTGGNNTGGNNTGGNSNCGNSSNLTDMIIWSDATTYTVGDTVYMGYEVNCTIIGNNYTIDSWLRNTTSVLYGGSPWFGWTAQWNPMQFSDYNANFDAGDYCLNATLYEDGTFLEFEETCFTIVNGSSGGNNTGGNNTGGNNTGGNNTGGSSNCGNDSNLTDLMVWTDATTYTVGDNVEGDFFVNCTINGETYKLDYEVIEFNTNIVHYDGEWNWTEQNNWQAFISHFGTLPAGNYCIHSTLEILTSTTTYSFVDYEATCFDIWNSTGGNNTGGNNTGGNNTGGNNTGGNNTGGNNTSMSCMSSMLAVDGSVNITGVNSVYNVGDQFNGYFDTCWVPSNNSMSLIAWLNSSNGINHDIQGYSGGNYWASNIGIQQLGPYGHWSFPIIETNTFGINYSSLNLPVGNYCWEALLKVYDGNTFAPVDTDASCFTVVNSSVSPCVGGNDTYPTGLEWITVSPVATMSSGIVGSGDPVTNVFEIGGLSNSGDCNATYKFAFNLVKLTGGTGGSGVDYAYPSDSSMSATGICVGTTACQFDIVKYPSDGCYTVYASLYSYPANQLLSIDDWEWWQVGNASCAVVTNTAPQVSSVVISPSSPTETDVLTCYYTYSDIDADPDLSTITWTINGVLTTSVGPTLSSGYTTGDFVICTVSAYDGTDYGNTISTAVLIMSNSSGGSGGGLPAIGVVGTIAAIAIGFIFTARREDEE